VERLAHLVPVGRRRLPGAAHRPEPAGSYRLPGRPWRFSREKLEPLGEPAFQGEHNRMVFGELGLGEAEIDRYIASGALVSASPAEAVMANNPQLVSSAVTDIRRHVEDET
jgi:hypothetical protein